MATNADTLDALLESQRLQVGLMSDGDLARELAQWRVTNPDGDDGSRERYRAVAAHHFKRANRLRGATTHSTRTRTRRARSIDLTVGFLRAVAICERLNADCLDDAHHAATGASSLSAVKPGMTVGAR